MRSYIYKITHIPTGHMYFGQKRTVEKLQPENDGYMGSPAESNVMSQYPDSEKTKEILAVVPAEGVGELESLVIQEAWEKYGKVSEGGLVTNLHSNGRDYIATDEVRAKLSAAMAGKKKSAETRAKIAAGSVGKKISPETKAKMSASRIGNTSANKRVINLETGESWESGKEAAEKLGMCRSQVSNILKNTKYVYKKNAHLVGVLVYESTT